MVGIIAETNATINTTKHTSFRYLNIENLINRFTHHKRTKKLIDDNIMETIKTEIGENP